MMRGEHTEAKGGQDPFVIEDSTTTQEYPKSMRMLGRYCLVFWVCFHTKHIRR
jgi:hypothetical protein